MNDSETMKAISASRIRTALRGAMIDFFNPGKAIDDIANAIMESAVEIQRPDTVLKTEHDLVVAKNKTLLQLVELLTSQLNAERDRNSQAKTGNGS